MSSPFDYTRKHTAQFYDKPQVESLEVVLPETYGERKADKQPLGVFCHVSTIQWLSTEG